MFVGLISDTHGVWDKEFQEFLEPCDQIWHAGDWGAGVEFTRKISDWKPVVGVYGNCDGQDIRGEYPAYQFFECGGMSVLMTHIGGYPGHYLPEIRILLQDKQPELYVCGHSHILKVIYDKKLNLLHINPGAAGTSGFHKHITMVRLAIDGKEIKDLEIFDKERRG